MGISWKEKKNKIKKLSLLRFHAKGLAIILKRYSSHQKDFIHNHSAKSRDRIVFTAFRLYDGLFPIHKICIMGASHLH